MNSENFNKIAQVIVPLPVEEAFDYAIPTDGVDYGVGDYVCVPIGSRREIGIINALSSSSRFKNLKKIIKKYPLPPLPEMMLIFIRKVSDYTMSPIGEVMKATLRGFNEEMLIETTKQYQWNNIQNAKMTPQRKKILQCFEENDFNILQRQQLINYASTSVINDMVKVGLLRETMTQCGLHFPQPDISFSDISLGHDQQKSLDYFNQYHIDNHAKPFLLDGITGSGKTEVYFEMMASLWEKNPEKQILILLPEIGLVDQTIRRFQKRFNAQPVIWHSQITESYRKKIRCGIIDGTIKCVVGARSGLFLPFKKLGMIIVDEEHDSSYKQQEGIRYHARDMAVLKAHTENIPIILASATPSLETFVNAEIGRYHKLVLRERFGEALLPQIHLIDLKENHLQKGHWISSPLIKAITETAFRGEQSLLFLNRRGYAPLLLCQGCGYRIECPFCSAWLVYHRHDEKLKCHQCGQSSKFPEKCGSCGATDKFTPCGPGVERLHEEVKILFPHLRSVILSSDTQENLDAFNSLLRQVHSGEINILIGTQMIAKGHHFPYLTCVGIIDADLGLQGGDLRAAEKSFQILEQVSGRAGREALEGHVYVQTYNPSHPVMTSLAQQDRDGFLEYEAQNRSDAHYPPFSRMAALILSCEDEKKLAEICRQLIKISPPAENIQVYGPAPAPILMLRGRYRYRFLIRSEKRVLPQNYIKHWLRLIKIPKDIRLHIDIDPISFL